MTTVSSTNHTDRVDVQLARPKLTALRAGANQIFRADSEPRSLVWALGPAAVVVVATLLALLRVGGPANSTLWGEDGAIFLQGAHDTGYVHTLLLGYDGYLHLVPRTIARIAVLFPVKEWALAISVTCAIVTGLVAAFVSRALSAFGLGRWFGLVGGLSVPLASIGLYECSNVACNIQWFLAAGCFWALMWAPLERRWIAAGSALAFLTAGSAPLVLTMIPIAIARILLLKGRGRIVPAFYFLGSALQIFTMFHSTREAIIKPTSLVDLLKTTAVRLYAVAWFGQQETTSGLVHSVALTIAAAGLVWLIVIAACWRSGRSLVLLAVGFIGAGLLFGAGTYFNYLSVTSPAIPRSAGIVINGRYTNSPSIIIITTVIAALLLARNANRLALPVAGLIACLAVAVTVHDFHYFAPRQAGPTWASSLAAAQKECATGKHAVVPVGVAPTSVFAMHLSCDFLAASR